VGSLERLELLVESRDLFSGLLRLLGGLGGALVLFFELVVLLLHAKLLVDDLLLLVEKLLLQFLDLLRQF